MTERTRFWTQATQTKFRYRVDRLSLQEINHLRVVIGQLQNGLIGLLPGSPAKKTIRSVDDGLKIPQNKLESVAEKKVIEFLS